MSEVDAGEFLDTIFGDITDDEVVCVTKANEVDGKMLFWNLPDDDKVFNKWEPSRQIQSWYFAVSSVSGERNAKGTALRRRATDVMKYYVLVLDDIGTKATPPPLDPTYKMTTSLDDEGNPNEQWGFALAPGEDFKAYEALVEYCHEQGWGDEGAGGCYRVMRVPGSANIKKGRNNFRSVITEWRPDRVWTLKELALALGCDDLAARARAQKGKSVSGLSNQNVLLLPNIQSIDPLHVWLGNNNHIVNDDGKSDFIDIVCPWADKHTTGSNTAGYSPLGRGNSDWVMSRGFKCLHAHCKGKGFSDAMKEFANQGAPRVSGVDPLPWLQHRFVYIGQGKQVADLVQRPDGGTWVWEFEDWGNMHKGRVMVPGRDTPIEMKTAYLEHKRTRKVTGTHYWPVKVEDDEAIFTIKGQEFINVYVPPNHPHTSVDPDIFLDHVDFLLPSDAERDIFLDWLAYKLQNPDKRSYAVLMIAEDGYGVGRSWLKAMLTKVLQDSTLVQTATLAQLIGKGTSAEQNYNSWAARCQFLVVEEAKDNLSKEDFYNGYETFKQNVDNRIGEIRVNNKYGRIVDDFMWFNTLIFSNHSDALAIPVNDRRICVLTNPAIMADVAYYDRLEGSLNEEEAARVYWYLMERDLSGYDQVYPPATPGKVLMTEQNVMPSEAIRDHILEACEGDIFTKKMLKSRVISAAHALDYDGISNAPGGIIRTLWGKMGKLRDDPRGARYYFGGGQVEVRAMRNKEKWLVADKDRLKDFFEEEILKNDKTGGKGLKIVISD